MVGRPGLVWVAIVLAISIGVQGCSAVDKMHRETDKMMTVWQLIDLLTTWDNKHGIAELSRQLNHDLIATQDHPLWIRYRSEDPLALRDGLRAKLELSQHTASQRFTGGGFDLEGGCIHRDEVRARFLDMAIAAPPRSPAPGAATFWKATVNGKNTSFGFRNKSPDCLSIVSFRLDADEVPLQPGNQ